jgi:hypothetical protein
VIFHEHKGLRLKINILNSSPVSGLAPGEYDMNLGNLLFTPHTIVITLLSRGSDSRRLDFSSATYRRHGSFLKMHPVCLIAICLVQLSSTLVAPTSRILVVRGANACSETKSGRFHLDEACAACGVPKLSPRLSTICLSLSLIP